MPKVDIKVKNKGLLEVPEGKKVNELPFKHFEDLVDKKGYDKIIKALNNLQVWNKNDDPKLSKWAEDIMEKLKKKFRPEESSKEVKVSAKEISHPLKKGTKVKIDLDNGYAIWTVKRYRVRHDYASDQDYYQYVLVKENDVVINDATEKNIVEVLKEIEATAKEVDIDKLYEEFEKETLKRADEEYFEDFARGYGDYEDGEDFQKANLEDYIEPALEEVLKRNGIEPDKESGEYFDLEVYQDLMDKLLDKANVLIYDYWESIREEEEEVEGSAKISDEKISALVNKHAPHNKGWKWEPNHKAITVYFKDVHSSYAEDEWDALLEALYPKFLSDVMVANSAKEVENSAKEPKFKKGDIVRDKDLNDLIIVDVTNYSKYDSVYGMENEYRVDYIYPKGHEDSYRYRKESELKVPPAIELVKLKKEVENSAKEPKFKENDKVKDITTGLIAKVLKVLPASGYGMETEYFLDYLSDKFSKDIHPYKKESELVLYERVSKKEVENSAKHYIVHESIGNYSDKVFESDDFYEVQDYLDDRWAKYAEEERVGLDDEKERELFDSYFHIEEKEVENSMIDDSEIFKVGEVVRHKITGKDYLIHDFYNEDEDEGGFYQVLALEELETGEESTQPAIDFERISDKDFAEKYPEYYVGSSKEEFKIGDTVRFKDGYSGEYVIEGTQYDDEEVPLYSLYNKETGEDLEYLAYAFELVKPEDFKEPEQELKNSGKGFHVGDKVKIKDRGDNQVYEITDISDDEEGDKFFNLYSFKLDDIIEEPFYDYELEHASIKCSKVAQAINKLSAKENYYFSDIADEGEVKVYSEKELIRIYQDVIKEHNLEIKEDHKFAVPETIKDVERLANELGHIFKPSKLNELSSKLKAKIETSANTQEQGICPVCGSDNIEYYGGEVEDEGYYYGCECNICHSTWDEWYDLVFDGNYNIIDNQEFYVTFYTGWDSEALIGHQDRFKTFEDAKVFFDSVKDAKKAKEYLDRVESDMDFDVSAIILETPAHKEDIRQFFDNEFRKLFENKYLIQSSKKCETSATEALNKTPEKSKVRKALDAIFPACDLEIRFPEKTVLKEEVIKENLDKNKKHEYLAQSSKVAKALKKINK